MTRACWREVGVWGDRGCPELLQHVHCSNCPVFVREARGLLDRPIDATYLAWLTETVASRADEAAPPDRVVLVFGAGDQWFAIDAAAVRTVSPVTTVRRLPHRVDPALLGLVSVRGELMPCVSLATLLAIPGAAAGARGPGLLVVLAEPDGATALLVDTARGVEGIRRAETRPAPDTIRQTLLPVTEGLHVVGDVDASILDRVALAQRVRGALG